MFEVKATDLAARIGVLETKSGRLETPAILPVIHPAKQTISTKLIQQMGFKGVMTNAYITLKNYGQEAVRQGIHKIIDYDGIIMTDSGGYQVLLYGEVDADPKTMADFEEGIRSDIAIVLDKPTGLNVSRAYARGTVKETIAAAKLTIETRRMSDILWVGPIQGGKYLDLVSKSAKATVELGFDLYALGSPTEVMEHYDFSLLVGMIIAAKKKLPVEKPLHLFGAGHPLTIPLAVALGCDLFDSASYILYARANRYMTEFGTKKLDSMNRLSCSCPECSRYTVEEIKGAESKLRIDILAKHNLYVLKKEIESTKEAIEEGRLWEYLGLKARAHPNLLEAYATLARDCEFLEDGTPLWKSKALFYYDQEDLRRPEILRHEKRLKDVRIPRSREVLLIVAQNAPQPYNRSELLRKLLKTLGDKMGQLQVCYLSLPYVLVPAEISDIFPLSQYVSSIQYDSDCDMMVERVVEFLTNHSFSLVLLLKLGVALSPVADELRKRCESIEIVESTEATDAVETLISRLKTHMRSIGLN